MNVEKVDIVRLELLEGGLDGYVEIFPMVASVVYGLALPKLVAAIIRGISGVCCYEWTGTIYVQKDSEKQAYFVAMTSMSRFFF